MTVPQSEERKPFVKPADYYSSPSPVAVLPRGVTFGCAGASLFVLLLVFAAGLLLSGERLLLFMDFSLGRSVTAMTGMYAADVTTARRTSLEAEIDRMRENLRGGRISIPALQPFLQELQRSISDERVTSPEAAKLEQSVRKINATAKR